MGMFGEVTGRVVAIVCSTYTTFAVQDAFTAQGYSEDDAKTYLSQIFLAANVLAFVAALVFGFISQYFRITSLLMFTNGLMVISAFFLIWDLEEVGITFTVSFVLAASLNTSNFVLSQTMLTRKLKDDSRGTILSF